MVGRNLAGNKELGHEPLGWGVLCTSLCSERGRPYLKLPQAYQSIPMMSCPEGDYSVEC